MSERHQLATAHSWIKNSRMEWFISNLHCDKDLNTPRTFSSEAKRELASIEKKLQDAYVECLDSELNPFLVILPSTHSPKAI